MPKKSHYTATLTDRNFATSENALFFIRKNSYVIRYYHALLSHGIFGVCLYTCSLKDLFL